MNGMCLGQMLYTTTPQLDARNSLNLAYIAVLSMWFACWSAVE